MKKIRIGNDIRLAVDLNTQLDLPAGSNNVRQVSAYLINTTRLAEYKKKAENRSRFIGRFPKEPFSHDYDTTPWCLCGCGKPTWNAYPTNAGCVYSGFGTEPYKGLKELKKLSQSIQYRAACYNTQYPNTILVDFPADQQLYAGVYTLILVVKLYTPGYADNIKTVSKDIPNIFEIVKSTKDTIESNQGTSGPGGDNPSSGGQSSSDNETIETGVTIVVGPTDDSQEDPTPANQDTPDIPDVIYNDIYVNEASISNGVLSLGRTDDQTLDVDLGGVAGWYEGD
jgi:hypothetical protein